jgi:signal transduction histidine kinase
MTKTELQEPKKREAPTERRARTRLFFFPNLSIRHRLPLLMATLLFGAIVASTWASYRGVRESGLEVGRERLLHLTQQFASMLQQSSAKLNDKTLTVANDPAVRSFLRSASQATRTGAVDALKQSAVTQDPNNLQVELWNADHSLALTFPENLEPEPSDLNTEFKQCASDPFKSAGAIRVVKDVLAYPSVAAVKDDAGKPLGYLVRWRKLSSTPEARKQLTNLLGSEATLYFGNSQGDVWTDLEKIVAKPQVSLSSTVQITTYKRDGDSVMALGRPISGTPWFVMVEIPERTLVAPAGRFLRRMILMGLVLFAIGVGSAFALSRGITRPLGLLTKAASAISGGDYSQVVDIRRSDELGTLANAFNTMTAEVQESQRNLEQRISARTAELETSNKELESFSYSVSHDLRGPLRAIDGFSRILFEEHSNKLDADALRVLKVIRTNTKQMGRLIDDLLTFSRLGRKSVERSQINMEALARDVSAQIGSADSESAPRFEVGQLHPAHGDTAMLRQVFVNLLTNAAKYSKGKDAPLVQVSCDSKNGENVYSVKDNGVGFDMNYADKLFGVFQRLHSPEEFEGTGVGLAIVQRIIHRHGGRVWANGKVNEGATFYFTLPKEQETNGKLSKHE